MSMQSIFGVVLASILWRSAAYPWGTNRCGPPDHPGGFTSASTGISVSISGKTVTLSSSSRFRGFYMSTDKGVAWTNPPSGTSISNLCGAGNTVWTHTSSSSRSSVSANLSCSDGQTVTITTYVVYSYGSPYVVLSKPMVCSSTSVTGTTVPAGSATGTTVPAGSGTGTSTSDAKEPVEPHYLIHGFVFIALFAILMPTTAFLILINKSLFYTTHKVLGVLAIILLALGWAILNWADPNNPNYAPLAYVNYGKDHKTYGSIGCYVASGVCGTGVLLWFLRLPKTMKTAVRYIHGIAGGLLALYGPFVVWTGWIRLAPATIAALDTQPLVWMSLAITLACIYIITLLVRKSRSTSPNSVALDRIFTKPEVDELVAKGKLVLIIDGEVCEIPPQSFNHPGGMDVLRQHNGREVGPIMRGTEPATIKNRKRTVAHSDYAIRLAQKMKIGRISSGGKNSTDLEQGYVVPSAPIVAVPPTPPIIGTIIANPQINKSVDFPVRLFRIQVSDLAKFGKEGIGSGSRVYMSLRDDPDLTRPYTVVSVNAEKRTVDFAIKIYPEGKFTSQLVKIKEGGRVNLSEAMMHASVPSNPSPPTMLIMIAGGTGITPMLSYIRECGKYALGGIILWWVRNTSDLFLTEELERLCNKYPLRIKVFFTQPNTDPEFAPGQQLVVGGALRKDSIPRYPEFVKKALHGRISASSILEGVGGFLPVDPRDIGVLMSGPDGFVEAANKALTELEIPEDRLLCLD